MPSIPHRVKAAAGDVARAKRFEYPLSQVIDFHSIVGAASRSVGPPERCTMSSTTVAIPETHVDLFNKKAFAHLATVNRDGTPQSTPVWIGFDGVYVLINSARGRRKDINMRERPDVALSMIDPDNPYRYLEVRGCVEKITEKDADAHIDALARRYLGAEKYPFRRDGEVRVIYKIRPTHVTSMG